MPRLVRSLATFVAVASTFTALSAFAKVSPVTSEVSRTVDSTACVRDLTSARCGRYQDTILLDQMNRSGGRADAATVRELGRRQLDALIASIG